MKQLTSRDVHARKVRELGLDPTVLDLSSIEAIAGALRRASFLCPCTATTLVRAVLRPLRGLVEELEVVKILIQKTLDAMVAHGDFLEHKDIEENSWHGTAAVLYALPMGFIVRKSGAVILVGAASAHLSILPDDLEARIEYARHLRRLNPVPREDLLADLTQLGLMELSYDGWLRAPPSEAPAEHLSRLDRLLDAAQPSRDIPGLVLLDSERPVRYYRGRWVEPRSQSGRFVARRSQAYGAQLWCYVELRDGNPERLIDFPITGSCWRGCDEAWRLQMAIDAQRGKPQWFRIRRGPGNAQVMELFSPLPMWAQRRLDAVGEPVLSAGNLLAYKLPVAELAEELRFVREELWLDEMTEKGE